MSPEAQELIAAFDFPDLRPQIREELHHAWSIARDEALLAYREWSAAGESGLANAYYTYVAAADREEAAALHLQRNVLDEPRRSATRRIRQRF
jgi:hypothetical protein